MGQVQLAIGASGETMRSLLEDVPQEESLACYLASSL